MAASSSVPASENNQPPASSPGVSTPDGSASAPLAETAAASTVKRKARNTEDISTAKRSRKLTTNSSKKHEPPQSRLCDFGGASACIEQILELVAMPICHPEVYTHTGVRPPRGVLLHGPPGCGKTMLAGAIAGVRFSLTPPLRGIQH